MTFGEIVTLTSISYLSPWTVPTLKTSEMESFNLSWFLLYFLEHFLERALLNASLKPGVSPTPIILARGIEEKRINSRSTWFHPTYRVWPRRHCLPDNRSGAGIGLLTLAVFHTSYSSPRQKDQEFEANMGPEQWWCTGYTKTLSQKKKK